MTELSVWLDTVSSELGISDVELDNNSIHTLLDLARDSAHEVERLAAPLTSYLVGVAVGRGQSLGAAAAKVTALALSDHAGSGSDPTGSGSDHAGSESDQAGSESDDTGSGRAADGSV